MIIPCDELVLTLLCERGGERGVVMFTSGLLLPLLLLLTTGRQRVVVGLQTVPLDNIAFRQEASQSLTLGQYKPGSKSSTYLNDTINQFNPDWRFCSFLGAFRAL